jgi:4-hydroxybenzoate polyprenyltransferase
MFFVKFRELLNNFSELVMFKHSIFSLPFIFIAMVVSAKGWFGWRLLVLGIVASVSARNFAMGVNRYFDRDIDILNPRTKNRPSVDGRVSSNQMIGFIVINATIFVITAFTINTLAFWLSFPILIILGGYTLFKRFSSLAHLVLGISLGLAPIAGVVAVENGVTLWSIFLAIGVMFWVGGFDLLYSLQDMEFDRENHLHSIPSKFGARKSLILAGLFHVIAVIFWFMFVKEANLGLFGIFAVVASTLMLGYEHHLVYRDFKKIDRAFFTVNGYLGFLFFILVVIDVAVWE